MSFLDIFRRTPSPNGSPQQWVSWTLPSVEDVLGMSPAEVWRTQPYLRTVVTFIARNIAQLGLHTFIRLDETDRQRDRQGPLARLLARPNPTTTAYELVYGLVADLALYDHAYWAVQPDSDAAAGWSLYRIPPTWVTAVDSDAFAVAEYKVLAPGARREVTLPADEVLAFHGWHPGDVRRGSTPVAALKSILAEQIQAMRYREQVWARGGRVSSVITRPAGVQWSDTARDRFRADWRSKWTGDGPEAGGTPILEDGMTLNKVDFSAHEQEFVEGSKLALSVVAGVYHVNPTMIGVLDNANYSNVREFRKMLYGDTLGPIIAMIEDRLNAFLVPRIDPRPGVYAEFNIAEKLQGSFEEQAAAMQTATGAPWMTRAEARSRNNLPAIPGADALVVPLNVLTGGQASPTDSAPKAAPGGPVRLKARAPQTHVDKAQEVLDAFFARQAKALLSRLGAAKGRKAPVDEVFDSERWHKELSDDLFGLNALVATAAARKAMHAIGLGEDDYDEDRTLGWLRANADGVADGINETTRAQVAAAIDDGDDPVSAVRGLFDGVIAARAAQLAVTQVTSLSGFGTAEAARQSGREATKTWVTLSGNPRPSHAAQNGETVALDDVFSNGARWPGDSNVSDDERSGCTCDMTVNVAA